MTPGENLLIESLPAVLSQTERVCSSVNVASTKAGMNVDAIKLMGRIILRIAQATKNKKVLERPSWLCLPIFRKTILSWRAHFLGAGEPECVINVGVSGPGVVKRSIERLI